MGAWPFLMGASDYSDYRVVVCPEFIESSGRAQAFRSLVETCLDGEADEAVRSRHVADDRIGPCSLFYRVSRVRKKDGSSAYDAAGRPLLRVDGVVVQRDGNHGRLDPQEGDRLIERALPTLDSSFAAFSVAKRKIPATLSKQLVQEEKNAGPARTSRLTPLPLVLFLSSALVVSVLGNAILLWGDSGSAPPPSQAEQQLAAKIDELAKAQATIAELSKQLREAYK
jgi:hypothetical protein